MTRRLNALEMRAVTRRMTQTELGVMAYGLHWNDQRRPSRAPKGASGARDSFATLARGIYHSTQATVQQTLAWGTEGGIHLDVEVSITSVHEHISRRQCSLEALFGYMLPQRYPL